MKIIILLICLLASSCSCALDEAFFGEIYSTLAHPATEIVQNHLSTIAPEVSDQFLNAVSNILKSRAITVPEDDLLRAFVNYSPSPLQEFVLLCNLHLAESLKHFQSIKEALVSGKMFTEFLWELASSNSESELAVLTAFVKSFEEIPIEHISFQFLDEDFKTLLGRTAIRESCWRFLQVLLDGQAFNLNALFRNELDEEGSSIIFLNNDVTALKKLLEMGLKLDFDVKVPNLGFITTLTYLYLKNDPGLMRFIVDYDQYTTALLLKTYKEAKRLSLVGLKMFCIGKNTQIEDEIIEKNRRERHQRRAEQAAESSKTSRKRKRTGSLLEEPRPFPKTPLQDYGFNGISVVKALRAEDWDGLKLLAQRQAQITFSGVSFSKINKFLKEKGFEQFIRFLRLFPKVATRSEIFIMFLQSFPENFDGFIQICCLNPTALGMHLQVLSVVVSAETLNRAVWVILTEHRECGLVTHFVDMIKRQPELLETFDLSSIDNETFRDIIVEAAIMMGCTQIVEAVVQKGLYDLNAVKLNRHYTGNALVLVKDNVEMLKTLVRLGSDLNARVIHNLPFNQSFTIIGHYRVRAEDALLEAFKESEFDTLFTKETLLAAQDEARRITFSDIIFDIVKPRLEKL